MAAEFKTAAALAADSGSSSSGSVSPSDERRLVAMNKLDRDSYNLENCIALETHFSRLEVSGVYLQRSDEEGATLVEQAPPEDGEEAEGKGEASVPESNGDVDGDGNKRRRVEDGSVAKDEEKKKGDGESDAVALAVQRSFVDRKRKEKARVFEQVSGKTFLVNVMHMKQPLNVIGMKYTTPFMLVRSASLGFGNWWYAQPEERRSKMTPEKINEATCTVIVSASEEEYIRAGRAKLWPKMRAYIEWRQQIDHVASVEAVRVEASTQVESARVAVAEEDFKLAQARLPGEIARIQAECKAKAGDRPMTPEETKLCEARCRRATAAARRQQSDPARVAEYLRKNVFKPFVRISAMGVPYILFEMPVTRSISAAARKDPRPPQPISGCMEEFDRRLMESTMYKYNSKMTKALPQRLNPPAIFDLSFPHDKQPKLDPMDLVLDSGAVISIQARLAFKDGVETHSLRVADIFDTIMMLCPGTVGSTVATARSLPYYPPFEDAAPTLPMSMQSEKYGGPPAARIKAGHMETVKQLTTYVALKPPPAVAASAASAARPKRALEQDDHADFKPAAFDADEIGDLHS
jgi:hypothetical protein